MVRKLSKELLETLSDNELDQIIFKIIKHADKQNKIKIVTLIIEEIK